MAAQFIRRNFNWLWYFSIGANLSLLGILWSCGAPTEKQTELQSKRRTSIIVDHAYVNAIAAVGEVYQARFNKEVFLTPRNEKQALSAFLHDSVQLIIIAREPDSTLRNVVEEQGYTLYAEPIGFSAKVLLAANEKPIQFHTQKSFSLLQSNLFLQQWLSQKGVENTLGHKNLTALFDYLIADTNRIGIVDLYQLKLFKKQHGWPYGNALSILPAHINDTLIYPNYEAVAKGDYPYFTPIYFYLKQTQVDQEESFLNFLFNRDGQRILEKEGFVPRLEYPRTIHVKP